MTYLHSFYYRKNFVTQHFETYKKQISFHSIHLYMQKNNNNITYFFFFYQFSFHGVVSKSFSKPRQPFVTFTFKKNVIFFYYFFFVCENTIQKIKKIKSFAKRKKPLKTLLTKNEQPNSFRRFWTGVSCPLVTKKFWLRFMSRPRILMVAVDLIAE